MNKILIANWKMNPSSEKEAKQLIKGYSKKTTFSKNVDVVVCPPFTYLSTFNNQYTGSKLSLGSQDVFYEQKGSYTGEVSVDMIKSMKVTHVIVGHSERRDLGDTNLIVSKKVKSCIKSGLTPIVCIGEKKRSDDGKYLKYIQEQILESLDGVTRSSISKIIIAYEPIWALNTGKISSAD